MGFDLWAIIIVFAIIIAIYIFLVNKPDLVINWLKLDKGFDDERIEFGNMDSEKISFVRHNINWRVINY